MAERRPDIVVAFRVGHVLVKVSKHAAIRYRDRVRPGLLVRQVAEELARVAPHGVLGARPGWVADPPEWAEHRPETEAEAWLLLGDGIAFPLYRGIAVTCMTRGEESQEGRADRAARRRARKASLQAARRQRRFKRREPGGVRARRPEPREEA